MADIIQLRGGTAAQWTTTNPILAHREPGLETDTNKEKRGDGVTPWNSLPYVSIAADVAGPINSATSKTTPVDADHIGITDSAAGNVLKKLSWANLKASLKTYLDAFYESAFTKGSLIQGSNVTLTGTLTSRLVGTGDITIAATAATDVATSINAATAKTVPVDADQFGITDSAAAHILKKLTWANIKTALNSLYAAVSHTHSAADIVSAILAVARGGTGIGSYTIGNYINASGATTLQQRTPTQVREDIGAEPAFTKGSLIQGSNVTLTGTLANRLIGTGDVTIAASAGGSGPEIDLGSGRYHFPLSSQSSTVSMPDLGEMRLIPFYQMLFSNVNKTADRIAVNITVAGASTNEFRLGLFEFGGGTMTLITDFGLVNAATTGVKELTVNTTLVARKMYFLGIARQNNAANNIVFTAAFEHSGLFNTMSDNTWMGDSAMGYRVTGVTGAFSTSYLPTGPALICPMITLRLS